MKTVLKHFARDSHGSANLWVAFCVLMFFMLAAVLFNAHALYSRYYTLEDELVRCASITLDSNIHNVKLRDVITDVQYQPVINVLDQNLSAKGWQKEGSDWVKYENGRRVFRLTDLNASVSGSNLRLTATATIPLPWKIANLISVRFPIDLYAKVLYIS